jgi:hypothetical protein
MRRTYSCVKRPVLRPRKPRHRNDRTNERHERPPLHHEGEASQGRHACLVEAGDVDVDLRPHTGTFTSKRPSRLPPREPVGLPSGVRSAMPGAVERTLEAMAHVVRTLESGCGGGDGGRPNGPCPLTNGTRITCM